MLTPVNRADARAVPGSGQHASNMLRCTLVREGSFHELWDEVSQTPWTGPFQQRDGA